MAEIHIKISDKLKKQAEESNLDLSKLIEEMISLKIFEKQLSESTALQRAVFESLLSKSQLSEKDAEELANKIDKNMLESLKNKYPNL